MSKERNSGGKQYNVQEEAGKTAESTAVGRQKQTQPSFKNVELFPSDAPAAGMNRNLFLSLDSAEWDLVKLLKKSRQYYLSATSDLPRVMFMCGDYL